MSGKEAKLQADGLEAAKVGIESGQGKISADGESGEVGIHPDLGRGGAHAGKFKPQFAGAMGFCFEATDMGPSVPGG